MRVLQRAWRGFVLAAAVAGLAGCAAGSRGDAFLEAGRPAAAVVAYGSLDAEGAWANRKLGLAFYEAGLVAAARREFSLAVQIEPTHPAGWYFLATLAERAGEDGLADRYWATYVRLRPGAEEWLAGRRADPQSGPVLAIAERYRRMEVESIIHPERRRGMQLLRSLSSRSGLAEDASGPVWDPSVTDATSWRVGAQGLPEFPPPPGGRP